MTRFLGYFRTRAPLTYSLPRFLINIPNPVNHVPFAAVFESIFAAIYNLRRSPPNYNLIMQVGHRIIDQFFVNFFRSLY